MSLCLTCVSFVDLYLQKGTSPSISFCANRHAELSQTEYDMAQEKRHRDMIDSSQSQQYALDDILDSESMLSPAADAIVSVGTTDSENKTLAELKCAVAKTHENVSSTTFNQKKLAVFVRPEASASLTKFAKEMEASSARSTGASSFKDVLNSTINEEIPDGDKKKPAKKRKRS